MSVAIHITQIELGIGIPLFSSKGVPLHRSLIVLWNTSSIVVHPTQIVLGIGIPLFSSKGVPLHRSLIVLYNPLSGIVHRTQKYLGNGIPLFSKGGPFTQGSCVVTTLVCGYTLLEISTPRHSRTSKKHGNRQADGGEGASHTGSLAENVGDGESRV